MAILFLILIAALLLGSAVLYAMNLHWWRVSLIVGVMFGAVALLWVPGDGDPKKDGFDGYTPADRLKPGIDLAGGTRLTYDVVVPEGQPKSQVIEDTIEILSKRADPSGTRGLVWREVAGNRIEVQMATAPAKVREAREAYDKAKNALSRGNLTDAQLTTALESNDPKKLKGLAEGNKEVLEDLNELKVAFDKSREAGKAYFKAQVKWDAFRELNRDKATPDHPLKKAYDQARVDYFEKTQVEYDRLRREVLAANRFDINRFEELRSIPVVELSAKAKEQGEKTPRQLRLETLLKQYPNRADKVKAAYDALVAYEAVKGPLDGPDDLIALLKGSGVLEFRIAANPLWLDSPPADQDGYRLTTYVEQLRKQGPRGEPGDKFRWFEVDELEQYVDDPKDRKQVEDWLEQSISNKEDEAERLAEEAAARASILTYFRQRASEDTHGVVAQPHGGRLYLLLHNDKGLAMTRAEDWAVKNVQEGMGQLGRPTVNFGLDGKGAALMGTLTGANIDRPMAVLIDDKVLTTPSVRGELRSNIEISGDFSKAEVQYLRDTMRAGALEGQLSEEPVSKLTVGATLGADNVQKGLRAALTALILVAIFMAAYYFFAGLVANFALAANMVLILGILALTQATFTLPGIAGLVLTIGMAVDANVLIFERIREELMDRKVSVEIAARQGYGKALSTILDANITTLITCLILGYTATSDVKGFAVVLGIGILATLFTALFCTKVLIDLYIRYRKPSTLEMLPTMVPAMHKLLHPKVNWISKAKFVLPFSVIIIVGGLLEAFAVRGVDMLDIEFRSGSSVGFDLKPTGKENDEGDPILLTLKISEARERIARVATIAEAVQDAREADKEFDPESGEGVKELREAYESALAAVTKKGLSADKVKAALESEDSDKSIKELAGGDKSLIGDLEELSKKRQAYQAELGIYVDVKKAVDGAYDRYKQNMADYEQKRESGSIAEPDPVPDFALLKEAQVVPTGKQTGVKDEASGFNVATLITDSRAVQDLMKAAFAGLLRTTVQVDFEGEDQRAGQVGTIVQMMKDPQIGKVFINESERMPRSVTSRRLPEFAGGVAMYVKLKPTSQPLSPQEVTQRVNRTRLQPPFDEGLGVFDFEVVGVERASGANSFDDEKNQRFTKFIVVAKDGRTDYRKKDDADGFRSAGGFSDNAWELVKASLKRDTSFNNVTVFNSQVSGTMQQRAVVAILLSLLAVVAYIWLRFGSFRYGLAAIAALVHDVSVALGLVALAGLAYNKLGPDSPIVAALMLDPFKINLAMIAAFLTIIGYSLNDTIVVFDRIRENRGRLSRATPEIINESINQTISRTVLTSGTTLIAVGTLYVFGGDGVHGFAFAMLLGVLIGTYSSIAIAAPILVIGTKGEGPKAGANAKRPTSLLKDAPDDEPDISSEPAPA